ncbi:G2/M phase-specific E3 ubiquitin-protein ligase-like [Saccostrea cucullata]|uniref:G2/M phase-specific E3 ubiquitin-protein ligase-like n=1 Tax=Saccostrea cuccullata TaxID=36930 RepID=UPI002ED66813
MKSQLAVLNAVDLGGPRREFFSLVLRQIQEKYFDPVREYSNNYEIIGKIFALSILQNGPLPRILSASLVEEVFNNSSPRSFVQDLRKGLNALGLYELACHLPTLIHLFTPRDGLKITLKMLTNTLKPQFSPEGSNRRQKEGKIYAKFVKYLREAASGRRGEVTLARILQFCTGCEEEPPLGYTMQPTIEFIERESFLPTGNTCINKMQLTIPIHDMPTDEAMFHFFDFAFCNTYFGLQ